MPKPRPEAPAPTRSELSEFYIQHFASLQEDYLVRGLLRTDGGGVDVPFDANDLTQNFMKIAFFAEFSPLNDRLIAQEMATPLRRWERPVVISVEFGESVSPESRRKDTSEVERFARRLASATKHPISTGSARNANLHVLILNEDERREIAPLLQEYVPGIAQREVNALINITKNDLCITQSHSESGNPNVIGSAVVIIREEHPDLLRQSCIHEEIAQSLGLSNDSDAARPSIFNDDEEFALLTTHDEQLLRILYDSRLSAGMDASTARPIVNEIATELMGGEKIAQSGR
ncbi:MULTISPECIES: DUF2927 domain-containing protein [Halocynthiibacter]|uniref:DUF2927 domain-containing protein n=1 Tax=Halocynthiibacter halioticoli TaxID=2986804 RepID=A0AAE3J064_9RHOB|nr:MULTISPECIES: DUF2927 domain-containing protein [Halocynthiibacter]MCV6825234.1 DUF2927 domain-containing protein [Halocynthiibacter halioticoli]MCW4058235.1 DUF2927 domain-containing protein [Halocynthiibacter sp. SDUM655004]